MWKCRSYERIVGKEARKDEEEPAGFREKEADWERGSSESGLWVRCKKDWVGESESGENLIYLYIFVDIGVNFGLVLVVFSFTCIWGIDHAPPF